MSMPMATSSGPAMSDMSSMASSAMPAAATSAMSMGHGADGMMGMDMGECSMSMLGNWQTIGACFLTSSWRISTEAQFAGTCIGVFMIVVLIESVRRWGREWDKYIIRTAMARRSAVQNERRRAAVAAHQRGEGPAQGTIAQLQLPVSSCCAGDAEEAPSAAHHAGGGATSSAGTTPSRKDALALEEEGGSPIVLTHSGNANIASAADRHGGEKVPAGAAYIARLERAFFGLPKGSAGEKALKDNCPSCFRPTVLQQFIRSLVYAVQFTGAYIVMLIAMSFNGYILISIILGGLVGHFFSTWDTLCFELEEQEDPYLLVTGGAGAATGFGSASVSGGPLQARARTDTSQAKAPGHDAYGQHSGACCG